MRERGNVSPETVETLHMRDARVFDGEELGLYKYLLLLFSRYTITSLGYHYRVGSSLVREQRTTGMVWAFYRRYFNSNTLLFFPCHLSLVLLTRISSFVENVQLCCLRGAYDMILGLSTYLVVIRHNAFCKFQYVSVNSV